MSQLLTAHFMGTGLAKILVESWEHKRFEQLWSEAFARVDGRKCELCPKPIAKGERTFRPVGNTFNRFERVHASCLERAEKKMRRMNA